jgi:hypothetical protein
MSALLLSLVLAVPCLSKDGLPDHGCTPGEATDATLEQICHRHTSTVRHVSDKTKRLIAEMYGTPEDALVEIDHLIPLELGGENSLINLWAEPSEPRPGYHEKDELENRLHKLVCAGKVQLKDAQRLIAADWVELYWRLFPTPP